MKRTGMIIATLLCLFLLFILINEGMEKECQSKTLSLECRK